MMEITYTPSTISKAFMSDDSKMRVLMGPVGSGKA
jgi:RecG-like helicase